MTRMHMNQTTLTVLRGVARLGLLRGALVVACASTPRPVPTPQAKPAAPTASAPAAGSAALPTKQPPPAAGAATLPVVPFRIVSTFRDDAGTVLIELHGDGTVTGQGIAGRIDGANLFYNSHSDPIWTVDRDGTAHYPSDPNVTVHFDDKDQLVMVHPKRTVVVGVDDHGAFTVTTGSKVTPLPKKVEAMTAKARRAALILLFQVTSL